MAVVLHAGRLWGWLVSPSRLRLTRRTAWQVDWSLDHEAMAAAMALLPRAVDAGIAFVYVGVVDQPDYPPPGDTFERIDRVSLRSGS